MCNSPLTHPKGLWWRGSCGVLSPTGSGRWALTHMLSLRSLADGLSRTGSRKSPTTHLPGMALRQLAHDHTYITTIDLICQLLVCGRDLTCITTIDLICLGRGRDHTCIRTIGHICLHLALGHTCITRQVASNAGGIIGFHKLAEGMYVQDHATLHQMK